jgi:hypothetical protein
VFDGLRTPAGPVRRAWLHPTRRPNAASGQQTPRPRLVPALAGGVGRRTAGCSRVTPSARCWRLAGPGSGHRVVLRDQFAVGDRIQGLDLRLPRGAGSGALRGPGRRPCRPASADASWREIRVISPDASWQPSGSAPWEHRPAASRYMHATTSGKYGYYKFSLTLRMSPDRSVQAGFSPLTQPSSS